MGSVMPVEEYFYRFSFSRSSMAELPEAELAFLTLLQYAMNEINALMRFHDSSAHDFSQGGGVQQAILIQRHVALRTWSAKLFELHDMVKGISGGRPKGGRVGSEVARASLAEYEAMEEAHSYSLVKQIRHEATSHFSFEAAKKNLRFVGGEADFSVYLHEKSSNSFYPAGEELMFIGRFNRYGSSDREYDLATFFQLWLGWNVATTRWAVELHRQAFKKLILERFPDAQLEKVALHFPEEAIGEFGVAKTPVILRDPQ